MLAGAGNSSQVSAQENPAELYKIGLGSVRFLMSVGDLVIGWLLQQQAAVASFFAKSVLPLLTSTRTVIDSLDNAVMELDEAAF
jgi:hypothetical protein